MSEWSLEHTSQDVKSWCRFPPGVGQARPNFCPSCHACARVSSADNGVFRNRLNLHGHGVRERTVIVPQAGDRPSERITILIRRYRCTQCRAVFGVAPRGVLPRKRYVLGLVLLAVALWVEPTPTQEVRQQVAPDLKFGPTSAGQRWPTVMRWGESLARSRKVPASAGTRRERAGKALSTFRLFLGDQRFKLPGPEEWLALAHHIPDSVVC